jgi:hypothetical protein
MSESYDAKAAAMERRMGTIGDGYYFMFEIGWFIDLLIPTLVRVRGGRLYLVGSKPSAQKDLKPCCIPAGGTAECKALALEDPSLKAFKSTESLVLLSDPGALEQELELNLERQDIQDRYFNSTAKKQREATVERLMNDYRVLSKLEA